MFDPVSGQVFKEWVVPRHSLSAHATDDWSRQRPYPLFKPRGGQGPRSLVDMAVNVIANNIGDVKKEYFEGIPVRMQWRIWRFLEARGVCLHAWKIFSQLLLSDEDEKTLGLYRFRQHICRPDRILKHYVRPLTSLTTEFITHLVISGGCGFEVSEMTCLTDLKNLGILELIQPADELRTSFPEVSDRLIRGWTEADNPFPLLRILRIWCDGSTTQGSLRWISKFPSLVLYDVKGSRQDWRSRRDLASEHGWEIHDIHKDTQGLEDSLLRYLLMLAPLQDIRSARPRGLAKSIDSDLVSLCSDSRCAVKFVEHQKTPPLLDYLADTAKVQLPFWDADAASREARACHGIAFEAWAFWLYSFIGQLTNDRDLVENGFSQSSNAVAGPFVLPSKSLACLFLGHSGRGGISAKPAYVSRGLFDSRRYTFIRISTVDSLGKSNTEPKPAEENTRATSTLNNNNMPLKTQKRKRMEDLLKLMTE